jgi:hypothetical protein
VAGLASLLGVLLKKSSNINQKTPPAYAKASAGFAKGMTSKDNIGYFLN